MISHVSKVLMGCFHHRGICFQSRSLVRASHLRMVRADSRTSPFMHWREKVPDGATVLRLAQSFPRWSRLAMQMSQVLRRTARAFPMSLEFDKSFEQWVQRIPGFGKCTPSASHAAQFDLCMHKALRNTTLGHMLCLFSWKHLMQTKHKKSLSRKSIGTCKL
jgi:hypothetical protein